MSDKAQQPAPCPICGNDDPEVDYGLSDAPFSTPFVTCPTIHIKGDITSRCPMHADGIEAWNYICEQAARHGRVRPPVEAPDEVISDLEFASRCDGVLTFAGHREGYVLRVKAAQMIARHLASRTATEDAAPKHLPEAADMTGCSRVWFGVDDLGKPWWRLDVIMESAETASYAIIPDRATLTPAPLAVEALTLIERIYYMEGKPAEWRAAQMNGVARDAQDGKDLAFYRRMFNRAPAGGI